MRTIRDRKLTGTTDSSVQEYETRHRKTARCAAAEGMVLLKNEHHLLPLKAGAAIALYGAGATKTVKGGTGSGDVNSRETVSVWQGLKAAGFSIQTEDWLEDFDAQYEQARLNWRQQIWEKADSSEKGLFGFFDAYSTTPLLTPSGKMPVKTAADTAIYVLARNAGEGADRFEAPGDYYLSDGEKEIVKAICSLYPHVIFVLNVGGLVDLSFLDDYPEIESVLYMHQPGMEAGNALADIVSGKVTPSGKLTDSWPERYADYPNAKTFSHNNGDVTKEYYSDGIYVGYRYFDTFEVPVRYSFGFGLSYTDFAMKTIGIEQFGFGTEKAETEVKVQVTNTGSCCSGREVVQVYSCAPQEGQEKEYRRLVGFAKTAELKPGEMQEVLVRFPVSALASFEEAKSAWTLEKGVYGLFVGNSLESSVPELTVTVQDPVTIAETKHICPLKEDLQELHAPGRRLQERRAEWLAEAAEKPGLDIHSFDILPEKAGSGNGYDTIPDDVKAFTDTLSEEQLIGLATGEISRGQGSNLGSAGISVPGSAAETGNCAKENGLAEIVLADGPAGLRLNRSYDVVDGIIQQLPFDAAIEGGFLNRAVRKDEGIRYYQYCTAYPVGTLLAQTWDPETVKAVGREVAEELRKFGVTLWLAPGMNIHRNPLCGRNFEYYSEDPVMAGTMAAAMTAGVQEMGGVGTTIKHFACNNQEDNRMGCDSIVSERALREIYLRGFEIAVRTAQPMAIMTSYNKINGVHAANCFDTCTEAARNEWGFRGVIMTDWTTTTNSTDDVPCTAAGCMRAGNDLVMPGAESDHTNIREELASGKLDIAELRRSIGHLVNIVWQSERYTNE
ncbi:MAG: glycoside hydrolase family 3 C-terminal domain-containing protein [Lachnospiraceae bacterium]|jgi:beta-glucosidase|nr:glycoside hydrolase family 3 C-terminal domain-containing protein [Lachnospiraceae bacterium]